MNSNIRSTNCPLCTNSVNIELEWRDRFSIAGCDSCKLLFSSPMPEPEELADFYQGFLYRKPDIAKIESLALRKCTELKRHFGDQKTGSRFLDFGAGTGVTTHAATLLGWDVHFQDVDEKAHQFVRENLSINDEKMHFSIQDIPLNHFDMIMCDNVIEHVMDPVELVRDLTSRLRVGGTLVFKTPNAFNTELYFFPLVSLLGYSRNAYNYSKSRWNIFKTMKRRLWNCDPPRHLFSFIKTSFEKMCELAQVSDFEISYYHIPSFMYLLLPGALRNPSFNVDWLLRVGLGTIEILAKPIYLLLKSLKLISSGGISLKIKKTQTNDR